VLHQTDVIKGLELFPEERLKVLMIAFKRSCPEEAVAMKQDGTPDWKANHVSTVIKAAQSHPIFGKIGSEFIRELSNVSADRIYMPGDLIIEEGSKGDSLFIMVSGHAVVYTYNNDLTKLDGSGKSVADGKFHKMRIGMLTAGSISGEMAMLGISQKRSASIEAETICAMWEISHEKAMPIIDRFPDSRAQFLNCLCSHLEHTVTTCIDSCSLFQKFDRKFRMLLGLYCERRAFFPGAKIFVEGHPCDGLYILNLGMAALSRKSIPIKNCSPGAHLNSSVMVGIHKQCFCTLTATHTCHLVVIARASYIQALEQYPANHIAQEIAKQEQIATDDFREKVRRLCARGLNKSQPAVAGAFKRLTERVSDVEVLRRAWKLWDRYALESSKLRRERASRKNATQDWIHRQRGAVVHRASGSRSDAFQGFGEPLAYPHQTRKNKYSKLSTLYLGDRSNLECIVQMPKVPRQRQYLSESSRDFSGSHYSPPRTPRDARAIALGRRVVDCANDPWFGCDAGALQLAFGEAL
jgi:CRP-like cAMP-binding protein